MSLRGRYIIDRIKRAVSSHLKMPVPPYGDSLFWEQVYNKIDRATPLHPETQLPEFDDTFEWGNIALQDVLEYRYRQVTLEQQQHQHQQHLYSYASSSRVEETFLTTTFGQTIGEEPSQNNLVTSNILDDLTTTSTTTTQEQEQEQPILMLGCGNSKMGEDMIEHGWQGPIIQVDISAKALELIERRSRHLNNHNNDNDNSDSTNQKMKMKFLQEDATHLSSLRNDTIHATIDKGLLDALFCADEYDQMEDIVKSVLRVLKPGGIFCIFSFSRPEFLLPRLLPLSSSSSSSSPMMKPRMWQSIHIQELERLLIYRLQKSTKKGSAIVEPKRYSRMKKQ
jgi:SAM-dependent methyltransferase